MVDKRDDIYASALDKMVDFRFDERVVSVFPDMIQRSVPGYATLISNIGIMAAKYAQPQSHCYDLGCSLGAVTLSIRQRINAADCDIVAVDNSPAMLEKARQIIEADKDATVPVQLVCADINDIELENASVVVMNFTLQFIPVAQRQALIDKIYQALKPGGVFILSEKIKHADPLHDEFHIEAHHDFKRANGYSDLEISQKRTALENVLLPETLQVHYSRLNLAGFTFIDKWFQCYNFVSMVAVK